MLSKEECKLALENLKIQHDYLASNMHYNYPFSIEMLEKVQYCFEELITEHFELVKEYKDVRKELECYYEMMSNAQPYKFEELKEGMWVWDSKTKFIYLIHDTHEEDMTIEVVVNDRDVQHMKVVTLGVFEENRFFPVQMENVGCEKDD